MELSCVTKTSSPTLCKTKKETTDYFSSNSITSVSNLIKVDELPQ